MNNEEKRAYDRDWYATNKERLRNVKSKRTKQSRKRNSQFVFEYLMTHPCIDCGEDDPIVLEFDHKGNKSINVSDMISRSYSIEKIKLEIQKCDVRCANCHRRKTAKDFNWYMNTLNGN